MKQKIIHIVLFSLLLCSCDKYLDVQPKGKVIPQTINDFDLLLNGGNYNIHSTADEDMLFLSADDFKSGTDRLGDINNANNILVRIYRWDKDLYIPEASVNLWNNSYNNLYTYNLVVTSIDEAKGNDEEARVRIKAEARTMRAYEYYLLINSFAKQYDAATAAEDPGVPLVTKADVSAKVSIRASVQEIYDFMIADLSESAENLPDQAIGITRPGKATGYGLLARVYLQMGDYEKARTNASLALNYQDNLSDYTDNSTHISDLYSAQQYMFRYYGYTRGFYNGFFSEELLDLFDLDKDARIGTLWGKSGTWVYDPVSGWTFVEGDDIGNKTQTNISHCVSVPEMYVIRAECNARLTDGTIEDVLNDLNTLRAKRIKNYTDSTNVTTKAAALKFALDERRREMASKGMRWFDLKRLNKEAEFAKMITHVLEGQTYTLEPNF